MFGRLKEAAHGWLAAPLSPYGRCVPRIARCLPPDQLIVSFFCPTGAFFGNVSDSTPS